MTGYGGRPDCPSTAQLVERYMRVPTQSERPSKSYHALGVRLTSGRTAAPIVTDAIGEMVRAVESIRVANQMLSHARDYHRTMIVKVIGAVRR